MITFSDQVIEQSKRAIAAWGEEAQLRMFQEEAGEAIAAVNQALRANRWENLEDLTFEVADLAIMLAQMQVLLGKEQMDKAIAIKLEKMTKKLEESEFYRVRP